MNYKIYALLMVLFITGCVTNSTSSEMAKLDDRIDNLETKLKLLEYQVSQQTVVSQAATPQAVIPQVEIEGKNHGKAGVPLNVEGRSYGGIVRSGPGIRYVKVLSLHEGDKLTLLEQTHVVMNGYPWFKIKTEDGTVGYQWGGILCSYGTKFIGAYRFCE
ncbi:hypothetical protein [Marinomonas sp. 2405UD68-3]|uniref:hypothetical protein n=1 Tax=Marinomonas sp. 2405UD68-3 TaxID=3391835 RepID=UPI0039C9D943